MNNNEIQHKACTLCKKVKPASEFISAFTPGLTNRCADCRSRGQRAHAKYVNSNREKVNRYQAEYVKQRQRTEAETGTRVCVRCLHTLPVEKFSIGPQGSRFRHCDECRDWMRRYQVASRAKWSDEKRRSQIGKAITRQQSTRRKCFEHYGMQCACCGESHYEFLTMDHIEGDGCKHRADIHADGLFRWLIRHDFPPGFRTLCWNCNWSFGAYGYCPHQKEKPLT